MGGQKLGSEAYQDLLSELWVELDWLKMKAEVAADAIDDYQESLPEDESCKLAGGPETQNE
jgi:hypothetical protein